MIKFEKILNKGIIIFLVMMVFLIFSPFSGADNSAVFQIKKGEKTYTVAERLKNEGIINMKFPFLVSLFFMDEMKAGWYKAREGESAYSLSQKISKGRIYIKDITIIEGWTLQKIGENLRKENIAGQEEFLVKSKQPQSFDFSFLEETETLEGFIFPDTYKVPYRGGAEKFIKAALSNFQNKTKDILSGAKKEKTLYEILTMASILEKEVKTLEEKKIAAGIFWKRLENNWPLQADATLSYALKKGGVNLTKKDKEADTPYNTYKFKGLPPAPISNPGIESLEAAANPLETSYWFYLSAPSGETYFSETLKEHNIKRNKYLN